MDKYEFMNAVQDIFDECETTGDVQARAKEMRDIVNQLEMQTVGFRKTMGMK